MPDNTRTTGKDEATFGDIVRSSVREVWREDGQRRYQRRLATRLAWTSGIPELTLALCVVLVAAFAVLGWAPDADSFFGLALRVAVVAGLGATPYALYRWFVEPFGAGAYPLERSPAWFGAFVFVAVLVAGAAYAWSTSSVPDTTAAFALLGVGFPAAIPAVVGYGYSGQQRHLLLGVLLATAPVALFIAPDRWAILALAVPAIALVTSGVWGMVATRRLMEDPPPLAVLESGLRSEDKLRRFGTAAFLCGFPEPRIIASLVDACLDSDEVVCREARWALLRVWGPDALERFEWHLAEIEDEGVDLDELTDEEAELLFEDVEVAEDAEAAHWHDVRQALRNACAERPDIEDQLRALATLPLEPDGRVNAGVPAGARMLVALGQQGSLDFVLGCAASLPEPLWMAVADGFGVGDDDVLEWLIGRFLSTESVVRARIGACLLELLASRRPDELYTPDLMRDRIGDAALMLLTDPEDEARGQGAILVGALRMTAAVPLLERLFRADAAESVRVFALVGMRRVDRFRTWNLVREALDSQERSDRRRAIAVIRETEWEVGARVVERRADAWIDELSRATDEELDDAYQLVKDARAVVLESHGW